MIARNDDSGSGHFTAKKFVVVTPEEQPKTYVSVLSHVKVELPEQAMRYTSMPNAVKGEGIWAASGVNEANVAMTATETITTNPRVQGADPLVIYQPAGDGQEEVPGGIGEEDIVCLVLPYIKSAGKELPDWDIFWKPMEPMKTMESLSKIKTRSGGWRRSADITGWQEKCRMMCMW